MADPVKVESLGVKSHERPDEVRSPDKTRFEVVRLEGVTLGRGTFAPGWSWHECIKPIVKTQSCQLSHIGHAISGTMTVRLDDGTERTITAGDSYTIPPGHDAWVEGDEPFVGIEVLSAEAYARS